MLPAPRRDTPIRASLIDSPSWRRLMLVLAAIAAAIAINGVVSAGADQGTVIEFTEPGAQVSESSGTHVITVVGTLDRSGSIAVDVRTVDGSAVAGADFVAVTQTLEVGEAATVHQISIEIVDDAIDEADETFVVALTSNMDHVLGQNSTHTVTILNDDVRTNRPPELDMIGKHSVAEGDILELTVTATDPDAEPVSLTITPELEPWASFVDHGDGTATLIARPGADDAGTYGPYTIIASDGSLTTTRPVVISVTDVADDPAPQPPQPITATQLTTGSASNTTSASTPAVSTAPGTLTIVAVTSTAGMDPAAVLRADGVAFSLLTAVATGDTAPRQLSVYQTTDAVNGPITINVAPDKNIRWSVTSFGSARVVQSSESSYAVTGDTTVATVTLDGFASPHHLTYATAFTQAQPRLEDGYSILASEGGEATLTAAWHDGEDRDPTWILDSSHWIMAALEIGPAGG